ncbi:oxygenase MpaB family protein [Streptomyces sp. NPDC049949]|uniref:oxygenase MpaB family protein n=1 Tax=Streptomyces sp. NPDC049949 TaxID=3154627 RepID=UPI003448FC34
MAEQSRIRRNGRFALRDQLLTLDPEGDHLEIYRISAGLEFPFDYLRGMELALLRTFAIPSIAALLDATGEFACAGQRRYDDTFLLMGALVRFGCDSSEGRTALRTINRAHSWYRISNDDMLYTLAAFVLEPVRWIDRFGWRPLTRHERHAAFHLYRDIGHRLAIRDLPGTYEELASFYDQYGNAHQRPTPAGHRVAEAALHVMACWFPAPLRYAAKKTALAVLAPPVCTALGYQRPPAVLVHTVAFALRVRARWLRHLCSARTVSLFHVLPRVRTYTLDAPGTVMERFGIAAPVRTDHPGMAHCPGHVGHS